MWDSFEVKVVLILGVLSTFLTVVQFAITNRNIKIARNIFVIALVVSTGYLIYGLRVNSKEELKNEANYETRSAPKHRIDTLYDLKKEEKPALVNKVIGDYIDNSTTLSDSSVLTVSGDYMPGGSKINLK